MLNKRLISSIMSSLPVAILVVYCVIKVYCEFELFILQYPLPKDP